MKTAESIELWKKRFSEQALSGMKVPEWCQKNNITLYTYYYWHAKINKESQKSEPNNIIRKKERTTEPLLFAEVSLPSEEIIYEPEPVLTGNLSIKWNEFVIHISNSNEIKLAAELMKSLVKSC